MSRMSSWSRIFLGATLACLTASASAAPPRAVKIARTTAIPACTVFVDAAARGGDGTVSKPFRKIADAVAAAAPGAVICVAEGVYREQIAPGVKPFTLAGGFRRATSFTVRDSAAFVSKAQGNGRGSFIRIEDPGPSGDQLTAIDGFEITGYSQAVYRDVYFSQQFSLTNNFIHDNVCAAGAGAGAGFSFNNVSGVVARNVFSRNSCPRGGAGALNDSTNSNTLSIRNNLFEDNEGSEVQIAHGGALYLFGNRLLISGNLFTGNAATG